MTLLRAPPCRLVLRLHRPAVTAPRRFLSHLKRHELNRPLHVSLKPTHDYVHLRKGFATSEHPLSPDIHSSDILLVDSATIVPASVAAAKPEHFVNQIRPLEPLADFHKTNLVVFLATPSFAPWLLDDRIFVEKALAKLYKNLSGTPDPLQNMQAICAVVDRLPEAKAVAGESGRRVVMGDSGSRAQQPPVAETGHEGIAYVVLPAKAQASAQPKIDGEIGCIDFLAHTHTDASGGDYTRVRVPLANTVFQTGKPCTLTASSWEWSRGENKPVLQSWRERKTVVINLSTTGATPTPSLLQDRLHQEAPVLSIPLLPLTMPRQVDGHMGNIIRGIIGPDEAKITASTELEKVVPRYFKSRGEPAQATSAWALVIPKDRAHIALKDTRQLLSNVLGADVESMSSEDYKVREQQGFESLWQQQPPRWNVMIQEALMRGARLHKVLSGGGGWGKKAGLLSLDPVPVGPPARELPADEAMADDYDSVDEFSTALKPVVEDGDFIQFFISAIPAAEGADTAAFTHLKEAAKPTSGHAWNWEFGVIPSTVDSIPGGSWQHTGKPSEDMAVFRGTFGALSEGGLTLMHARNVHEETGVAKENINTTTVDVPFSRWSAFRLHSRDGVKTGAAGDSENNSVQHLWSSTVHTQYMTRTGSPLLTPTLTLNIPGSRAKSTSSRSKRTQLRNLFVEEKARPDPLSLDEVKPLPVRRQVQRESKTHQERTKSSSKHKTIQPAGQKQQGSLVKMVASRPSAASNKAQAQHRMLSMDDITEQVRRSGKLLARMTEQLRLLTGLKGSQLEELRRWRERNKTKRLVRSAPGNKKSLVRTIKVQKHAPPHPPFHRPVKPSRLAPISQLANRISKTLQLTSSQLCTLSPTAPVFLRKHNARILPRSPLSRRPARPAPLPPPTAAHPQPQTRPAVTRPAPEKVKGRRGQRESVFRRVGARERRVPLRWWTVERRARLRRVVVQGRGERDGGLVEDVEDWLGEGTK